jgi:hypothetical protein
MRQAVVDTPRCWEAQLFPFIVMAGLVPAIHVDGSRTAWTWMPATGVGMTILVLWHGFREPSGRESNMQRGSHDRHR